MPMNDEEQLEFDRMKTARDSLLITNARLNSKLAERTWVGLTDEEARDLWSWSATSEAEKTATTQQHAFAKAIEAKLKEKNT